MPVILRVPEGRKKLHYIFLSTFREKSCAIVEAISQNCHTHLTIGCSDHRNVELCTNNKVRTFHVSVSPFCYAEESYVWDSYSVQRNVMKIIMRWGIVLRNIFVRWWHSFLLFLLAVNTWSLFMRWSVRLCVCALVCLFTCVRACVILYILYSVAWWGLDANWRPFIKVGTISHFLDTTLGD